MRSGSQARTAKGWSMLERNVERITDLVKGFLSFSKGQVPKVESVDPNQVAEEICNLYQDAARKNGIELVFEPSSGPAKANLDPEKIHTCLANLVSNAIDACQTSKNNGCTVTLRVAEADGAIVYEVSDTGCGMDYEIKNKVFTTFFTTKGLGGTGLGLMVTRKIVQEHGGKITVESTPGKGSLFRIEFPRDRLPDPV
jgi:signal transduction histidine kinase